MNHLRYLLLTTLLIASSLSWAATNRDMVEVEEKVRTTPDACSRPQSLKNAEKPEVVQRSRTSNSTSKGHKSVVWTSLPQAQKTKLSIGETERWVDVGVVPSLEKGTGHGIARGKKDFRSKSVKTRSARMIRVKKSSKKRFRDLKKQGVLDGSSTSMELVSYGNEEASDAQALDKEELKRLLQEALRKKKLPLGK